VTTVAEVLAQGLAHQRAGRYGEAERIYRAVLDFDPQQADALHLLGLARLARGAGTAPAPIRAALLAEPRLAAAEGSRASAEPAAAEGALRRVFRFDPSGFASWLPLAAARFGARHGLAAAEAARRHLLGAPDDPAAIDQFALARLHTGDAAMAERWLGRRMTVTPDDPAADRRRWSAHLLSPACSFATLCRLAEAAAARAASPFPSTPAPKVRIDGEAAPRLRLGVLGGLSLHRHTAAATILPLVRHLDATRFDIILYSDLAPEAEDDVTALYAAAATLVRAHRLDDDALAWRIRADRIDVLLDVYGPAIGGRWGVLARRAAPVQILYPTVTTSGLPAVDAVIADEMLVPPEAARWFTEPVERVTLGYLYDPLPGLPAPAPPPARTRGHITFGSVNQMAKIGPAALDAWARLLGRVPDARLMIRNAALAEPAMRARVTAGFAAAGADVARLDLHGFLPGYGQHLAAYGEIDIALDSFPYAGVHTTGEALAMGVPVITLAGGHALGRYGAAFLSALGEPGWIARDPDHYVEIAAALAGDRERLDALRSSLRARIAASPLGDAALNAREVGEAIWRVWRRCGDRSR
jgi:tetratricopeptide (TPR) repeat protein